ncbi:MAG: hypothetical protein IPI49_17850 [Myxococcales bacterium]|nr:hypothetical protein [Myxococcales bacterium]
MHAVILEVQRQIDPDKGCHGRSTSRRRVGALAVQVLLMVIALEPRVAAWARGRIGTGHPGFALRPVVISPGRVPRRVSARAARLLPELGVLSELAHPTLAAAQAALHGICDLPEERSRLYYDVIMDALPEPLRRALEADMQHAEYRTEFARKYVAEGRQSAALELARAKVGELTAQEEGAVKLVTDPDRLTALILALGLARDGQEARAALSLHAALSR